MLIKMFLSKVQNEKYKSIHPAFAIGVAITIAISISSVTFISFIRSDAFELVRLTHNTSQKTTDNIKLDDKSPMTIEDLNIIKDDSTKELELLNDDADFNSNNFSDASLGL